MRLPKLLVLRIATQFILINFSTAFRMGYKNHISKLTQRSFLSLVEDQMIEVTKIGDEYLTSFFYNFDDQESLESSLISNVKRSARDILLRTKLPFRKDEAWRYVLVRGLTTNIILFKAYKTARLVWDQH